MSRHADADIGSSLVRHCLEAALVDYGPASPPAKHAVAAAGGHGAAKEIRRIPNAAAPQRPMLPVLPAPPPGKQRPHRFKAVSQQVAPAAVAAAASPVAMYARPAEEIDSRRPSKEPWAAGEPWTPAQEAGWDELPPPSHLPGRMQRSSATSPVSQQVVATPPLQAQADAAVQERGISYSPPPFAEKKSALLLPTEPGEMAPVSLEQRAGSADSSPRREKLTLEIQAEVEAADGRHRQNWVEPRLATREVLKFALQEAGSTMVEAGRILPDVLGAPPQPQRRRPHPGEMREWKKGAWRRHEDAGQAQVVQLPRVRGAVDSDDEMGQDDVMFTPAPPSRPAPRKRTPLFLRMQNQFEQKEQRLASEAKERRQAYQLMVNAIPAHVVPPPVRRARPAPPKPKKADARARVPWKKRRIRKRTAAAAAQAVGSPSRVAVGVNAGGWAADVGDQQPAVNHPSIAAAAVDAEPALCDVACGEADRTTRRGEQAAAPPASLAPPSEAFSFEVAVGGQEEKKKRVPGKAGRKAAKQKSPAHGPGKGSNAPPAATASTASASTQPSASVNVSSRAAVADSTSDDD
eukprot:TRINITY_DN50330_c0_g1_i1.p1 TRINITY_DN50330_c0_g1~~TRINITY_DN50330_c0_g1_i1.p1  ORF type:complete len:576 (-),score=150.32 TRINITY_DN50330_c0_g1_i1:161-1888(-)